MATTVRDLMSKQLVALDSSTPVSEAAKQMWSSDIGAVLVRDDGIIRGIVTDRDIVVRAIAHGRDVNQTPISDICSTDLTMLSPDEPLERAVELMREKAIRRVLVASSPNEALGILSLGDVATAQDSGSVLGQISGAPPNS